MIFEGRTLESYKEEKGNVEEEEEEEEGEEEEEAEEEFKEERRSWVASWSLGTIPSWAMKIFLSS